MSPWSLPALLAVALLSSPAPAAEPPRARLAKPKAAEQARTVAVPVAPQAWQLRRARVLDVLKAVYRSEGRDKEAMTSLDKVLTDFEHDLVSITPMEAMDLQRYFYVPHDNGKDMKSTLTVVAMYATLGWYDALRFADASGRAELVNNERFFLHAFSEGDAAERLVAYLGARPEEAAEAVRRGQVAALSFRGRARYDERWPAAYGLQRMQCGLAGVRDCPSPPALPESEWDAAYAEAAARVERYYRLGD